MEGLTRLVTESLARHGFDRPLDYRRLHWSRWFRCDSHHSLLFVPSKPGVFAIAEEVLDLGTPHSCRDGRLGRPANTSGTSREARAGHVGERPSALVQRHAPRKPRAGRRKPLTPPAACSPSPSSSKTTTWPSSSTACSRTAARFADMRAPAWPPDATSSASSSSKTRPSAAASAAPSINGWSPPPRNRHRHRPPFRHLPGAHPQTEYVPPTHDRQNQSLRRCKDGHAHRSPTSATTTFQNQPEARYAAPAATPSSVPAARFRCRHQYSLSDPPPLRFLTGRAGDASDLQTLTPRGRAAL